MPQELSHDVLLSTNVEVEVYSIDEIRTYYDSCFSRAFLGGSREQKLTWLNQIFLIIFELSQNQLNTQSGLVLLLKQNTAKIVQFLRRKGNQQALKEKFVTSVYIYVTSNNHVPVGQTTEAIVKVIEYQWDILILDFFNRNNKSFSQAEIVKHCFDADAPYSQKRPTKERLVKRKGSSKQYEMITHICKSSQESVVTYFQKRLTFEILIQLQMGDRELQNSFGFYKQLFPNEAAEIEALAQKLRGRLRD